ncbi:hypothetical protein J2T17_006322 [Paenibacillus mucilaginosus]|uniref:hypothetical protein n=1 Tax=Paenibacillus mucilaginosus TaxID=61624 RepID=UPI003D19C4C8
MKNGIDFSQYPAAQQMIDEADVAHEAADYQMIRIDRDAAALRLAELLILCKAASSSSIPLRSRAKRSANYYHNQVRNEAHVFAQMEALREYKLSFDDLDRMMPHQNSVFLNGQR